MMSTGNDLRGSPAIKVAERGEGPTIARLHLRDVDASIQDWSH